MFFLSEDFRQFNGTGDYTAYLPGTQSQNVSSNRSPGGHSITRQAVMKMENKSKSMLWNKNLFYITLTK